MTETAGLQFGPQWLRDSFQDSAQAHGGPGGSGPSRHASAGSSEGPPPPGHAYLSTKLAGLKLAEFRYGREEILALFDEASLLAEAADPEDESLLEMKLWHAQAVPPLSLQGSMAEEEQRAWQRGANSDTSLRLYRKDGEAVGLGRGATGLRPPAVGRGGAGRGRGFERHRSVNEEEEFIAVGPSGRGRGRGFDRSLSDRGGWFDRPGVPGGTEEINGVGSPRKNYSRAPFDDWRKPGADDEDGGWRGTADRGRRWNAGPAWRDESYGARRFNEREYPNGAPGANTRWKEPPGGDAGFGRTGRGGGRGGHHGTGPGQRRFRTDSDHLPEWASEESGTNKGGTFDSSGKFQALRMNGGDSGEEEVHHWHEENMVEEEVDPDDLPGRANDRREKSDSISVPTPHSSKEASQEKSSERSNLTTEEEVRSQDIPDLEHQPSPPQTRHNHQQHQQHQHHQHQDDPGSHLDAGHLVSKLLDDDDMLDDEIPDRQLNRTTPPHLDQGESGKHHAHRQHGGGGDRSEGPRPEDIRWIYLDPQGQTQGPFSTADMFEWQNLGYFPVDLMVRRTCDKQFLSLSDMSKIFRGNPFVPGGTQPGPIDEEKIRHEAMLMDQMRRHQEHMLHIQQRQILAMRQQQQLEQRLPEHPPPPQHQQQHMYNNLMFNQTSPNHHHRAGGMHADPMRTQHSLPSTPVDTPMDPLKLMLQRQQQAEGGGLGSGFGLSLSGSASASNLFSKPQPTAVSPLGNGAPRRVHPDQARRVSPLGDESSGPNSYDPIQSLLSQLQSEAPSGPNHHQPHHHSRHEPTAKLNAGFEPDPRQSEQRLASFGGLNAPRPGSNGGLAQQPMDSGTQSIWDNEASQEHHQFPTEPKASVWNDVNQYQAHPRPLPEPSEELEDLRTNPPRVNAEVEDTPTPHTKIHSVQQLRSDRVAPPPDIPGESGVVEDFVKPKSSEKKDKKSKKAEERRRQKEAKKAADQATENRYIPGMQGSIRPDEPVTVPNEPEDELLIDSADAQQLEALKKLQEEHRQRLRMEELQRQEAQLQQQAKLAPWAKKAPEEVPSGMSLMEIQRLEEERERADQIRREEQMRIIREQQMREEEEMRRQQANKPGWASAVSNGPVAVSQANGPVKSLAEIQEEEARIGRERQEQLKVERKARQVSFQSSSVWGSAANNLSWASKAATSKPPAMHPANGAKTNGGGGGGFWDETPSPPKGQTQSQKPNSNQQMQQAQQQTQLQQQQPQPGNPKKGAKAGKGAKNQQANNAKGGPPHNPFENWCHSALESFKTNVDIPTFMTFLNDIESPYEVNDYVKSYIGEGKPAKNFAKEYLERRSRHKNALKNNNRSEIDDLLTPATAINPNEEEFIPVGGPGGGAKGKNRKRGRQNKGKSADASHLLGFSVQSNRINAGERDLP